MQNEPFANKKSGKEYYIQRCLEPPEIDGNLDEPVWSNVQPITDFLQEIPNNMADPTEKTKVYLTYDDNALYVAARLYDSMPSEITRQLAPRDDWFSAFDEMADWLTVDLDSRHDHQTGYSFSVNASGVLYDAMVYNDEKIDSDWDGIWQAEIQIDDLGWSIEMEIPFSNLSFYAGDKLTWGLNITRFIQRNYEKINWVTFPMNVDGIASKYGHLNGLQGIYPPAKFSFIPNFFGSTTMYSDIKLQKDYGMSHAPLGHRLNYYNDPKVNMGMDITYRLNSSSQFMLTLNPNFKQVESHPTTVNLTAYETYFKEKRPFFLKDVDIFNTPIQIFYSQRIGESWYEPVIVDTTRKYPLCSSCTDIDTLYDYQIIPYNIKTAGKLTGKTETGLSYGLLGAITVPKWTEWRSTLSSDSSNWIKKMKESKNKNYIISRMKQDLFTGNSYIGFMSTSSLEYSDHTYSVDGMANLFENQLGLEGQILMTEDEHKGIYGSISISPPGYINGWIDYTQFDKGLELELNNLGFIERDDYSQIKLGLMFQSYEPYKMIRNQTIILQGNIEENSDGLSLGKNIQLSYDMDFTNFWSFGGGLKKYFEVYDDREIFTSDPSIPCCPPILLPEVNEYSLMISTDPHKLISAFIISTLQRSSINETSLGHIIEFTYKPNTHFLLSTSYESLRFSLKHHFLVLFDERGIDNSLHYVFSNRDNELDILTFRATTSINRKLSFQGYLEIFSNHDLYSKYVEYLPSTNEYIENTAFIKGEDPFIVPPVHENNTPNEYAGNPMPVYTTNNDSVSLEYSYVDPNNELDYVPKLTSIRFNGVLKWNYLKGSNLYIIYSANKKVNGHRFDRISQFGEFITFNKYEPWVEVLRDQTFMIKIDYWFEN